MRRFDNIVIAPKFFPVEVPVPAKSSIGGSGGCAGRRPLRAVYRECWRLEKKDRLGVETFPDGTGHARSAGRGAGGLASTQRQPPALPMSGGNFGEHPKRLSFLFHRARRILFSLARQRKENGGCIPRPRPEAGKLPSRARGAPRPAPQGTPHCHPLSEYAKSAIAPPDSCTISQLHKYASRAYNAPIIQQQRGRTPL